MHLMVHDSPAGPKGLPARNAIALSVGDEVRYLGATVTKSNPRRMRERGDVGRVIAVRAPSVATGIDLGDGLVDRGLDGSAVVDWPSWGRAVIWPSGEGKRWERVPRPEPEQGGAP